MKETKGPPLDELIIEAVVGIVLFWLLWEPVYGFFSPIVDALLLPGLRALGL